MRTANCKLYQLPRLASVLLIFLVIGSLQIVRGQYRFDSWTTEDGLPQNSIRGITQTPDGYLWFTTLDGLTRFDGVRFTVFNRNNSPGIISNRFNVIFAAKTGDLWSATEGGDLTILRNNVFSSFPAAEVPGDVILGFTENESGEVLINTGREYFVLRGNLFEAAGLTGDDGTPKKFVSGANGRRWEIYPDHTLEISPGGTRRYDLSVKALMFYVGGAFEDRDGGLWIGDFGRLHHLSNGAVKSYDDRDGFPPNTEPHFFWQEKDGSIWFATGGYNHQGVGLVRFGDGKFRRFGAEAGLSNDRIQNVFHDREGSIWLATDKGLNRFRTQLVTTLSAVDGLDQDEVYPLLQTRGGDVLIGTIGGVNRYRDGAVTGVINGFGESPLIQSLWEDDAGRIWIGASGRLHVFENDRLTNLSHLIDNFWTVNAISGLPNGDILLGTQQRGVVRIRDRKVVAIYGSEHGLAGDDVKFIQTLRDGRIAVGTYGGLSLLNCAPVTETCQIEKLTTSNGLPSNMLRALYEDSDGTLWIGTYDRGLARFRDGRVFSFDTSNGLYNNGVFAIVNDDAGNFWMSSNNGIFRASRQQLNDFADGRTARYFSIGYGRADGMKNAECNGGRQPSSLRMPDGKIWFPTVEGVAIVDPRRIETSAPPPSVQIEEIQLDRQPIGADRGEIRVSPQKAYVDITYTAPSFIKPEQIRFRYRLEGLDRDWIDAGTRRQVNYSFLPPGEYVFTVTAANPEGVWQENATRLRIVIEAPFYRKIWFWSLLAIFAALILSFIYWRRVRQIRAEAAAREQFSRHLIGSQEAERARIARELHDGLGQSLLVIKNRALLGLNGGEKIEPKQQLEEIREAATEALGEVRSIAYNLRPLHLERLGLAATLEEMTDEIASAAGLTINFYIDEIDHCLTPENEMNFYRIVQECLNNVVKHAEARRASVTVERAQRAIILTVRDDGRGFDVDAQDFRAGLGLEGITERVRILGGRLRIETAPNAGTTITVEIELPEVKPE